MNYRLLRSHFVVLFVLISLASGSQAAAKLKKNAADSLPQVDAIVRDAVAQHQVPGAVVLIGHHGHVIYRKAFGWRSLDPRRERMTANTIFDLASLTKVIATTPCIMQLVEEGKIRLNDPLVRYMPEFGVNGKQDITVRQLMVHYSGLAPDLDLTQPWQGKETAYQMAFQEKPENPPGARFVYSDINYIMLGALVERVSGQSLNGYAEEHIFKPLKMTHTQFLPPRSWIPRIAPTQYDEHNVMLRGVVHDPTARRMGGVAGHAGLFSTADDLSKFCQALLDGKLLSPLTIEKMTTPQQPPNATDVRGLGWDIDTPFSSNRGELLPVGSYGHTGFTGTSVWIDPTTQTYIIILANGVHPRGKGTAVPLRSKVATAVAASLHLTVSEKEQLRLVRLTGYNEAAAAARNVQDREGDVKSGIDVLEAGNFALDVFQSKGTQKRIGLLTNQTGVDSDGKRTIDVLAHAPGVSLVAIFSPEHGVTGSLDTTAIGNTVDAATKIPVYSVYGSTDAQRRPSLDVLKTLDAVFIDLQNAGARYYTYETTMGYFLEAAAKAGIQVVVLDRPNPITGSLVQGPVSDPGTATFVNYFQEPVRHGMTMGELAQMFNSELNIHANLSVVPMQGWQRGDWYDSTSLTWINPS
ncbi:MAG: serine hydrolase, partial [Chlamydiota bacterium]